MTYDLKSGIDDSRVRISAIALRVYGDIEENHKFFLNNFSINSKGGEKINKGKIYFTAEDLENILEGAVLFSSGGGGDRESGRSLIEAILNEEKTIECISPESVDDKDYVAVVGGIGSPEDAKEFGFGYSARRAFELLEKVSRDGGLSSTFSCTVSGETGAISQFIAMLVAVQKGIPVIDGDGAGRAFPKLQMATFARNPEEIPIFPGYTNPPTDPNHDGRYEDVNGNGIQDFDDIVSYYDNMDWIEENASIDLFDYELIPKPILFSHQ